MKSISELAQEERQRDEAIATEEFYREREQEARELLLAVPSYCERYAREKQAIAQVAAFYPGYAPEQVETWLREYLANGEDNRFLVIQFRAALAQ